MKKYYDRNRPVQVFKVGDKVLLSMDNLKVTHAGAGRESKRKLTARWIGPFTVLELTTPDTYKLELPRRFRLHDEFHTSLLKSYVKDDSQTRLNPPAQALINAEGEECYLVEKIIGIKHSQNKKSLLVKVRWLGYSA